MDSFYNEDGLEETFVKNMSSDLDERLKALENLVKVKNEQSKAKRI